MKWSAARRRDWFSVSGRYAAHLRGSKKHKKRRHKKKSMSLNSDYFKLLALRKERSVHNNSFSQIKTMFVTILAGRQVNFQGSQGDMITGYQYQCIQSTGVKTIYFSLKRYDDLDWKKDSKTNLDIFSFGGERKFDPSNVREIVLENRLDWTTGKEKWREVLTD